MEIDFNRCFHFHRLAVQQIRFVLPLPYSIQSSLDEDWMPADRPQVFDDSRLTDRGLEDDIALNMGDLGHRGILRLDIANF